MSKIKAVMIGVNGFGRYITSIISKCSNIDLIGLYDIDGDQVTTMSRIYGLPPYYTLEEALACQCDAVIIEVPNSSHAELVKQAALAKKHIFVEKPITNSIAEAEEIVQLCRKQNVLLQVGHSARYKYIYKKAKELINSNILGRIVLIEANYSTQRAKGHTKEAWRSSRETCPGGPMLQLGIHAIDTISYLTGCKPLQVRGFFSDVFTETQNDDAAMIIMKMENGILAYVGSSYVSPLTDSMVVYGDNGKMNIRDNCILLHKDGSENIINIQDDDEDRCYHEQFESFANCILNACKPEVDGEVGIQNLKVVLTALESASIA